MATINIPSLAYTRSSNDSGFILRGQMDLHHGAEGCVSFSVEDPDYLVTSDPSTLSSNDEEGDSRSEHSDLNTSSDECGCLLSSTSSPSVLDAVKPMRSPVCKDRIPVIVRLLACVGRSIDKVYNDLVHESKVYCGHLRPLQGKAVPIFYGLWEADIGEIDYSMDEYTVFVTITENVGRNFSTNDWRDLPDPARYVLPRIYIMYFQ